MPVHPTTRRLLTWYARNARQLPWRRTRDPYAIWVAEVMLQQTRVDTMIPYYERFMLRFPDVKTLAESSLQQVLLEWEGLGYYSRARSLHRAAGIIQAEHGGALPGNLPAILRLPGIGYSSAADILSIAFGADLPALDGNIKRVLARLFDLPGIMNSREFLRDCYDRLDELLPGGRAGDFNQALMELGAVICTPKSPACGSCPLRVDCQSCQAGNQHLRPLARPAKIVPRITVTAGIIRRGSPPDGLILIARRPINGLLGGLWEFPGGKMQEGESLQNCLARELREELGVAVEVGESAGIYKHAYTHFRVTLHAFFCHIIAGEPAPISAEELQWLPAADLQKYPMGKLDRLITRFLLQQNN